MDNSRTTSGFVFSTGFLVYGKGTREVRLLLEAVGQAGRPDQGDGDQLGAALGWSWRMKTAAGTAVPIA